MKIGDIEVRGSQRSVAETRSHLLSHAMTRTEEQRYHWDLAPDLVHALAIGVAHGLAIHEHDADYGRNPTIYSREQSGKAPYLLVEVDDAQDPKPEPPTQLQLESLSSGTHVLQLSAPANGFAYEITVNGTALARHNIPIVVPSTRQRILLRDLPQLEGESSSANGVTLDIQVVTLNRQGDRSPPAVLNATLPPKPVISLPDVRFPPAAQPLPDIAVLPLCDKFDTSGKGVGNLESKYRTHNSLYDGQKIRLVAAAGEVVGFQLLARGAQPVNVGVEFESLRSESTCGRELQFPPKVGRLSTRCYRSPVLSH